MSKELGIERSWDHGTSRASPVAWLSGRWADADGPIVASRAFKAPGMPSTSTRRSLRPRGRPGDLEACDAAIAVAVEHGAIEGDFEAIRGFMRRPVRMLPATGAPARRGGGRHQVARGHGQLVPRSRLAVEAAAAAADLVATLHPRKMPRASPTLGSVRGPQRPWRSTSMGPTIPDHLRARRGPMPASPQQARADGHDDPRPGRPRRRVRLDGLRAARRQCHVPSRGRGDHRT